MPQLQVKSIPKDDAALVQSQLNIDDIHKLNICVAPHKNIGTWSNIYQKMLSTSSIEEVVVMYTYMVNIYKSLELS